MKCSSVGLEVFLVLNEKEFYSLRNKNLKGIIKFREVKNNYCKDINFELKYCPLQKREVGVKIKPAETYFGNANKIVFLINNDFYKGVEINNEYVKRFLDFGKLNVKINKK